MEHQQSTQEESGKTPPFLSSYATLLFGITILFFVPLARPTSRLLSQLLAEHRVLVGIVAIPLFLTTLTILWVIHSKEKTFQEAHSFRFRGILIFTAAASFAGALSLSHLPIEYAHIPIYGLLGFFTFGHCSSEYGTSEKSRSSIWQILRALVLCCAVSLSDEMLQGLHPERFFDVRDLWLNGCASYTGIAIRSALPFANRT
jgi:VanZ family protein